MKIPERLHKTIHTFCSDMWDGYLSAIDDFIEANSEISAILVVDRFHVAKHYRDGFDKLRKSEFKRLRKELPEESYKELVHGMHWVLRHNHGNLCAEDKPRLRTLLAYSPSLHQAYTLREELTAIFNLNLSLPEGQHRLHAWVAKVERSSLNCFDKFINTLNRYFDVIANYFHQRSSSGFVEGLNNKLKTITRRSYGLRCIDSLFRRLWLDINGYRCFCS